MSVYPISLHIVVRTKIGLFESEYSLHSVSFSFCGIHVMPPSCVILANWSEERAFIPKCILVLTTICNSMGCIDIQTGAVRHVQLVNGCLKMAL
jgi:hypothetical protein